MRPDVLNPLFADVTSLPRVGPTMARRLERLGIRRVKDLLFHLPVGWLRTRTVESLAQAAPGERIAVAVDVLQHVPARGRAPARAAAVDRDGTPLSLVFFGPQADRMLARLPLGQRLLVVGQIEDFQGRLQMAHPDIADAPIIPVSPVHRLTEGIGRRQMQGLVEEALKRLPDVPEWAEPSLVARNGWPGFAEALGAAHRHPDAQAARDRLAHDELFAGQLAWALVRAAARRRRAIPLVGDGRLNGQILAALPFALTGAQARVLSEIRSDLGQPAAMLRLLQGDVGAGKTLVAALALATAVEAGAQGALLAPTDLLARQHLATLEALFAPTGVRIGFLSGREKGRAREAVLAALAEGGIDLLVGTHAIFQESVRYRALGLAVIDEQHRFGVQQRMMLEARAGTALHLLVMTATPIPRSLALARHGALDVSLLDERPPGRRPIDTRIIAMRRMEEVLDGLARHLANGGQAYWVCPTVEEGEGAAVERAALLRARFGEAVALVHGRMAGPARDAALAGFVKGDTRLLVATTVIEVGVDVPAANLIVIEQAERFGLAQLHQLRGRVGRGGAKSVCLLLVGENPSGVARERLSMLRQTDDGFAIAEADLRLRGPGELLGTRQAGAAEFQLADEEQVGRLIAAADADARLLMERDGGLSGPRGAAARILLHLFDRDAAARTLRGG
ncbi:MAG: ATP-dependent DNA helicase RecG [Sphingomonadaceae bacterium]